mgnify:FL=1
MKKVYGKLLSFALMVTMTFSTPVTTQAEVVSSVGKNDIIILYDNDVHCNVDSYEDMAALKKEMQEQSNYVSVVSCGDYLQGDVIGAISKGKAIVQIMNKVGYDVVAIGNHEFDYGVPRLKSLVKSMNAKVVASNFVKKSTGKPVFRSYTIKTYGKKKVAFVGVTTPESFTKSTPAYFQNSKGEFIYDFYGDSTGKLLAERVQKVVNTARKNGADYVVALTHMGTEGVTTQWDVQHLIKNTYGIDVVLDGHSHSTVPSMKVKNKNGKKITVSSSGTKFSNIGQLVIRKNGSITTELIPIDEEHQYEDAETKAYIDQVKAKYEKRLNQVIGKTEVDLTTLRANGERAIRNAETNMGDFCTDAVRSAMDADVAIINGGGIRADIAAGDITYKDLVSVFPWNNELCVIEATGQQIKDALELGAKNYPEENGGFMQVSGMKYVIDASVPSSVVTDEQTGMFEKVDGTYRVKDIQVWNAARTKYEPIKLKKTYKLAGINYTLRQNGDGFTMFDGNKVIKDNVMLDTQSLSIYLTDVLDGVVGENYKDPAGQGRITIINK